MLVPAHDPDGDPVTYTVQSVTPTPTPLPTFSAEGLLSWTPPAVGSYTIVVRVEDGRGGMATAPLQLSVQAAPPNAPPEFITLTLPGPATEDVPYQTRILVGDPNGDPIVSFALDAASVAKGMDGQGLFTWTPQEAQAGGHSIIVTVADQRGATATRSYPLFAQAAPENHAPQVITTGSLGRATTGTAFTSRVEAWDPDGDSFTFEITGISPAPVAPPTIDPNTGLISWPVPELPATGNQYTLSIIATRSPRPGFQRGEPHADRGRAGRGERAAGVRCVHLFQHGRAAIGLPGADQGPRSRRRCARLVRRRAGCAE